MSPEEVRNTLEAAGRRLVKPLVEQAKSHEAQVLKSLVPTEKLALRKLLGKLARSNAAYR